MNLDEFKSTVNRQGLAKNTRWECMVFPPKKLRADNIFNFAITDGLELDLNLPGVDLIDNAIDAMNEASINFGPLSFQSNLNLPTLGFTLRNHGDKLRCLNLYTNMVNIPQRDIQNVEWRENGESRQLGVVHNHNTGLSISYYCSEDMRERLFFEQWQDLIFNPKNKGRSFYDDYIGSMEIVKYNSSWSEKTAVYKFHEVYPTNIAAQTMVYEGTAVMRLDINFKYYNYERIK